MKSNILTIVVFIACLWVGSWIAQHKPIWNDEFYSQTSSVNISYKDQFLGQIPEGANTPLFYVIQKLFLQAVHYKTPDAWVLGKRQSDPYSQVILRVTSIVFMSLSVTILFYYFCSEYSLGIAVYSLFIYCSSYMLWCYWAEARPYALIVFLTTAQSIVLLLGIGKEKESSGDRLWLVLAGINILLSFSSIMSIGSTLAVSLLWLIYKDRDWKKYILITLVPFVVVFFYYFHAPKYNFFFGLRPDQLIKDNISKERFYFVYMFFFCLSLYGLNVRFWRVKLLLGKEILRPIPFIIFASLVLAASALVLFIFALHAKQIGGFPVSSRYFIYLLPIGVIISTLSTVSILKALKGHRLIQGILAGIIAALLLQHFFKIVPGAIHSLIS